MEREPTEPIELSLLNIYGQDNTHKNSKIAEHISKHVSQCPSLASDLALGGKPSDCGNKLCYYFRWFYPYHSSQCSYACFESTKQESSCQSCAKLRTWVELHSKDCQIKCPISLCQSVFKKDQLSKRLTDPHIKSLYTQSNSHSSAQPYPAASPGTATSDNTVHRYDNGLTYLPGKTCSGASRVGSTVECVTITYGLSRSDSFSASIVPGDASRSHPVEYESMGETNPSFNKSNREYDGHTPAHESYMSSSTVHSSGDDEMQHKFSRSDRGDSFSSSIAPGDATRSHPSSNFLQGPVEYEPMEKANPSFKGNKSISISSSYSNVRNYRSETIEQYNNESDSEPINDSGLFDGINSEESLPLSLHPRPLPASSQPRELHRPIQRQDTHQNLNKKTVFGRNSISLKRTTQQIYHNGASPDSHVTVPRHHDARLSPRRSRILSERRRQQMKRSTKNVTCESPDLVLTSSRHNGEQSSLPPMANDRTTSPEGDISEDFSSPEDEEDVFTKTHRLQSHPQNLPREVYSPSSDSSPGPNSLEEVQDQRRFRQVLQRMDTDVGDKHSKILLANGSITPADAKQIRDIGSGLQDLVTLRTKKSSDSDSAGNRTSGVSSISVSNSSINSARSSGVSGVFSELEFSSMEQQYRESQSGANYETEDSSSTLMGNSDMSLNSELYHSQSHDSYHKSHDSYARQYSDVRLPYYHDSGHYDEPGSYLSGPPSDEQGPYFSGPPSLPQSYPGSQFYTECHQPYLHEHHNRSRPDRETSSPNAHPHNDSPQSSLDSHPHGHTSMSQSPHSSLDEASYSSRSSELNEGGEFIPSLPRSFIKESLQEVDRVLCKHQRDLFIMKHRPKRGGKIPTHAEPGMSEEKKQQLQPLTYPVDRDTDYFPVPSNYTRPHPSVLERERAAYEETLRQRLPDTPQEEEIIWESILARREHLKQYLVGQYYSDQVYREFSDWERKSKLGHGAQASCFSVCDLRTKCLLVMKEETENKKTLDEAYVSLKLACQSNPSPNIVEYYTAALLPGNLVLPPRPSPYVQIFMEQMPACLQGWLFKCGPIPQHNVHHYACQLFDALDFLHNKQGIIHCDIKPGNILVDDTAQRIKLTDFGSAEILEQKRLDYTKSFSADPNAGTLSYNPPEFYRERQCSFAFDVWQAGCCVLAMCTGRRPWRHLFMDVYPCDQSDRLIRLVKKANMDKIRQQRGGHPHPAFLDPALKKLLHGCLQEDPSRRLTAKECSYLLNTATASTEEERRKIVEALGYAPSRPAVLQSLSVEQPRVDIYLGSDRIVQAPISDPSPSQSQSVTLALYRGWLGSINCPQGMTYRQAQAEIQRSFPVAKQLGSFILATYDNNPHSIWTACSRQDSVPPYRPIRPDSPVDLTSAIVLSPTSLV